MTKQQPQRAVEEVCSDDISSLDEAAIDRRLLLLVRDGDALALHQLMQRHWQSVLADANRVLGDEDAAADIAQRTFITIWQGREQWKATGTVRAYIHRIARNAALNERRRRLLHGRLEEDHDRDPTSAALAPPTPLDCLEEKELRAALARALDRMPPRRREVYLLSRNKKLTHAEIGKLLGISPQTVANQLSTATAELRQQLNALLE